MPLATVFGSSSTPSCMICPTSSTLIPVARQSCIEVAGKDATVDFYSLHRHEVLQKYSDLAIGTIGGEKQSIITPEPGDLSPVPYAEPLWLSPAFKSPFYNESHRRLQKAMRIFTDQYIIPEALEKEQTGEHISQQLVDRMSKAGILHMRMGPGPHLHGQNLLGGAVDGKEFDYFHDLICSQESVRGACRGFVDGMLGGLVIGLPCIFNYCKEPTLYKRVTEDVLSGKKKICLAITEAFAGSDVANLRTTATKTPDGKHYIVNGTKKWITNGIFSDYFVTAVRTEKGLSVLLIERGGGIEMKSIKTTYSAAAGSTFISFTDVKVPVQHLLGQENKEFT